MSKRTGWIVGGVVGVLALALIVAVSLPAYCDYTPRAKMSEVLLAASACRAVITEVYESGGTPRAANGWGCEGASSKYVVNVATDRDGKITITIGGGLPNGVDGKPGKLTLVPMAGASPARKADLAKGPIPLDWRCGHPEDGTTMSTKYLPGSCRGTPYKLQTADASSAAKSTDAQPTSGRLSCH